MKGRFLQDEWAISQTILGSSGVVVQVPREELSRARETLARFRDRG